MSWLLVFAVSAGSAAARWDSLASPGTVSSDCSEATARQLVEQHHLNDFLLPNPVRQVLCGAFTGSGSEAMAITIGAPTCWGTQRWAVFSFMGGAWQLVLDQRQFIFPLVAVGPDIRETAPVFRPGDPRCIPSGGSHARTWHWNGSSFTAGPWKQVTPGTAQKKSAYVLTPLPHGVTCYMTDDGSFAGSWVYCWIGSNPRSTRHIKLTLDGRFNVAVTAASPGPLGIGGPNDPYGKQVTVGRFRCLILRSGIRCTVIRSGKGFVFNSRGARRVGP